MQHVQDASIDVFCLAAKKKVEGVQAYACIYIMCILNIYVCVYVCVCVQ